MGWAHLIFGLFRPFLMHISRWRIVRQVALGIFIWSFGLRLSRLLISRCWKRLSMTISRPPKDQLVKDTYGSLRHVLQFIIGRIVERNPIGLINNATEESIDPNVPRLGNLFPCIMLVINYLGLNFLLIMIVASLRNEKKNV